MNETTTRDTAMSRDEAETILTAMKKKEFWINGTKEIFSFYSIRPNGGKILLSTLSRTRETTLKDLREHLKEYVSVTTGKSVIADLPAPEENKEPRGHAHKAVMVTLDEKAEPKHIIVRDGSRKKAVLNPDYVEPQTAQEDDQEEPATDENVEDLELIDITSAEAPSKQPPATIYLRDRCFILSTGAVALLKVTDSSPIKFFQHPTNKSKFYVGKASGGLSLKTPNNKRGKNRLCYSAGVAHMLFTHLNLEGTKARFKLAETSTCFGKDRLQVYELTITKTNR